MIAQLQIIGTASYDFEFVSLQCTTLLIRGLLRGIYTPFVVSDSTGRIFINIQVGDETSFVLIKTTAINCSPK